MEYPQDFWNLRYSTPEYAYGMEPNQYFKAQLDAMPKPGRILLLCEGEGRNAVYAAQQGWQVTAVDFSETGQKKAMALAASRQVSIDYQVLDVAQFDIEKFGPWDAIALIYAHFPSPIRVGIHQACARALALKGEIWLEAFQKKQLENGPDGPKNPDMLYAAQLLAEDFSGLDIVENSELSLMLEEGERHSGIGHVVRLRGINSGAAHA